MVLKPPFTPDSSEIFISKSMPARPLIIKASKKEYELKLLYSYRILKEIIYWLLVVLYYY